MEFNQAAYERAMDTLNFAIAQVPGHINDLRAAGSAAAQAVWLPPGVGEVIFVATERAVAVAEDLWNAIQPYVEGALAPALLFTYSAQWAEIQGHASDIQGRLRPDQLPSNAHWRSTAKDRYITATASQAAAAGRVADIAAAAIPSLNLCAGAGLAFYIVAGAILIQMISDLIEAIAALGSEVFSVPGALLALGAIGLGRLALAGAVGALGALLAAELGHMNVLHANAVDHRFFPGGHWPLAVADTYSDATVTDSDAKWSVTN